jgi:hypothetical protein
MRAPSIVRLLRRVAKSKEEAIARHSFPRSRVGMRSGTLCVLFDQRGRAPSRRGASQRAFPRRTVGTRKSGETTAIKGLCNSPVRLLGILAFLVLTTDSKALAQDFEVEEDVVVVENAFELHESNFDRWIFGNTGNSGSAREHLESLLMLSIGEVDRSCSLNESQKKMLLLAGRGDIKHFLNRMAAARRVFDQFRHDQRNTNTIYQETVPLAAALRTGLFGKDSIFAKTIMSTLETEQAERYQNSLQQRNLFRHQAKVRLAVANLDQTIGFTADQRRRLLDLILQETKPSLKVTQQYESQVVLLKISRIPKEKIRQILDDSRWKVMNQQLQQARSREVFLKQNGFLDEAEPDSTAKNAETKKE